MSASEQRHAVPVVLTIAGSDSGGGAGIQADLKTFAALGVFGTSAITCITAQNPDAVTGITAIGMLYSAAIIRSVAAMAREQRLAPLVVDPVMVATSGARLLQEDAVGVLLNELLPLATVVTPNAPEAEILWGQPIRSQAALAAAVTSRAQTSSTRCTTARVCMSSVARGCRPPRRTGQAAHSRRRSSRTLPWAGACPRR